MSDFHIVVFFNDYYTLIVAFLTKQIQNRYRYRRLPDSRGNCGCYLCTGPINMGEEFTDSPVST